MYCHPSTTKTNQMIFFSNTFTVSHLEEASLPPRPSGYSLWKKLTEMLEKQTCIYWVGESECKIFLFLLVSSCMNVGLTILYLIITKDLSSWHQASWGWIKSYNPVIIEISFHYRYTQISWWPPPPPPPPPCLVVESDFRRGKELLACCLRPGIHNCQPKGSWAMRLHTNQMQLSCRGPRKKGSKMQIKVGI